ncbi:MAG: exodeoxyribonuclease V subunit gamma [Actinomycetota bacterium]
MAGLHLHQSEDLQEAVESVAATLSSAELGLLEKPWLVVPSSGIRQWLDGQLSENLGTGNGFRDGVTANLAYFFPEQLVSEVERIVLQSIGHVRLSWSKELLTLRIFGKGMAPKFSQARRLSEIIDNLNRWRPEALLDPTGEELGEVKSVYQALSSYGLRPHEQRQLVIDTLRHSKVSGLPLVVALVGLPNMPGGRQFGELLAALSAQCDVHIFEPVATLLEIDREPEFLPSRWNSESGEAKQLYRELAESHNVTVTTAPRQISPRSLLGHLQESMKSGRPSLAAQSDDTVKILGAYGNSRQIETLRSELLEILSDRTLGIEPHDILVITPDLPSFGPLLERHWLYEKQVAETPRLPIDYAERPAGHFVNRLDASAELLKIIGTRTTIEQLSEFVAIPAVGVALGLEAEEQDRLWALAIDNKVMAGTSNQQRASFELMPSTSTSGVPVNVGTWERFIDGVVTTYTLPAEANANVRGIGTIDDVQLLARLLPVLHVLENESYLRTSGEKREFAVWLNLLEGWVNELLPSTDTDRSFERELLKFREWSQELSDSVELSMDEFQDLWRGTKGPATAPNVFGRGGILVSGLTALPNVPFKVVALVGFDEANLPGASVGEGLSGERRIGEPSPRQSMLQALAQGILSATSHLIITFNAHSDESGESIEPAIPLEELIEGLSSLTEGTFKPVLTSRHEFFLSPSQPLGRTFDPRVRQLIGIESDTPTAKLDFAEYLDTQRADRRIVSVKELVGFYDSPQKFFLTSVAGAQRPPGWPETVSGASFEWSRWTTSDIRKLLVDEIRTYVREHREVDSVVHLVTDKEVIAKSLVKRDPGIAEAFDYFYSSLLQGLKLDSAKTGAIPPIIWQSAIDRDGIVYEALTIEAEFERFAQVDSLFPRTFKVGDWNIDASGELGDQAEAEFQLYREHLSGALRLVSVVSKRDRYRLDKKGPLTKTHFRTMLGLLLYKAAGVLDIGAELLYLEDLTIFKTGLPRGMGIVSITCSLETDQAAQLLVEILGVYAKVWSGPVPLFPKTTFAVASGESGAGAWEDGYNTFGEGSKSENLILYPYVYEDLQRLLSLDETRHLSALPYVSELRSWKDAFEFDDIKTGSSELAPRIRAAIVAAGGA